MWWRQLLWQLPLEDSPNLHPLLRPPHTPAGILPLEFATYTRWSWALQPAWYTAGKLKRAAHALFSPLKAAAWGLFGLIFAWQTRTPSEGPAARDAAGS